ncbi:MAG: phosphoadenylyl-sulfate reductase [Actinomycetota bacterium]|nr:phosphoadenylyl-sulfate reductase [Actinomycetota bacterium]
MTGNMEQFDDKSAQEVLGWALAEYGDKIGLACSFGAEDMVLVDMIAKIDPKARIFTLDTGRLAQETYNVMDEARVKYGVEFEVYFPRTEAVEAMEKEHGPNLFYNSIELRKLCCKVRKMEPLKRAFGGLDAWITGLRREQAVTRTGVSKVERDEANDLIKINPLADWSEERTWAYIKENDVPYNALHDQGYPSIGCAPCTRAVAPGEDVRAGRWWWETPEQKECGLHAKEKTK